LLVAAPARSCATPADTSCDERSAVLKPHRVFVSSTKKICDESNIRDQFGVICYRRIWCAKQPLKNAVPCWNVLQIRTLVFPG
jgi:hypothetical protein